MKINSALIFIPIFQPRAPFSDSEVSPVPPNYILTGSIYSWYSSVVTRRSVNGIMQFKIGDSVIYTGKTYSFPGEVCAVTDDGQIVVRAYGSPNGDYKGMKHIFGPSQLQPFRRE